MSRGGDPTYFALHPKDAEAMKLAALPPDWRGHSESITADWYHRGRMRGIKESEAEIARLRRIEEAARAYVALFDTMNYPRTAAMYPAALRAALETKEQPKDGQP